MWGSMIYSRDNVSTISTREKNMSIYCKFGDTLYGRVDGGNMSLLAEMVIVEMGLK
jgi:hypothetical protein